MAWALGEAYERQVSANEEIHRLRNQMWQEIQTALPDVHLNGAPLNEGRAGNNLHLLVPGIPSEPLINALSSLGLHASGGSA